MNIIEYKRYNIMKYIFQGIKDYCKDYWHDWLRKQVMNYGGKVMDCITTNKNKQWIESDVWKEGSIWYYIKQRKASKHIFNSKK